MGQGGGTEAAGLHVTSHQRAGAELAGLEAAEAGAVLWPAREEQGGRYPGTGWGGWEENRVCLQGICSWFLCVIDF